MADIQGTYDDLFLAVPNLLARLLDEGDTGGSVAVFMGGEPVVDVWGGYTDASRGVPWRRDTITNVWSVTKTMTALTALTLIERGSLDPDAEVARYWPEFGAKDVLVRHVLSHTAGLPDWPGTVEELYDWDAVTARLAGLTPQWEPGTEAGYHSLTQGYLVGELVRRITGVPLGDYFATEIAGPLGADFHIGLAAEHDHRVAASVPPQGETEEYAASAPGSGDGDSATPGSGDMGAPRGGSPDSPGNGGTGVTGSGSSNSAAPTAPTDAAPHPTPPTPIRVHHGNSPSWRRAQIPAASGYGNARSVALVQSRRLTGPTLDLARRTQFTGEDRILGMSVQYGLGYGLFGNALGWGGWGGSLVLVDPDAGMTVAYVTNQMRRPGDDNRGLEIVTAAYEGLGR
ncbi:serine hydrolase domain-containing protein [Streptomyces niveiscabiei]|uniref:serine hydrolase domain-containing protein n=3 Tax=Streptomyces niveiscabiei TaxID=164115 RepID=UPI003EB8F57C